LLQKIFPAVFYFLSHIVVPTATGPASVCRIRWRLSLETQDVCNEQRQNFLFEEFGRGEKNDVVQNDGKPRAVLLICLCLPTSKEYSIPFLIQEAFLVPWVNSAAVNKTFLTTWLQSVSLGD